MKPALREATRQDSRLTVLRKLNTQDHQGKVCIFSLLEDHLKLVLHAWKQTINKLSLGGTYGQREKIDFLLCVPVFKDS
jgi:hypothetical protein